MLLDSSQTCTGTETWIWGSGYCDPKSNFYRAIEVWKEEAKFRTCVVKT